MYVGTGRYLGNADLTDPGAASGIAWQQTMYGFKDKDIDYGTNLRTGATLVTQTLTKISITDRGISSNPVNWNTQDGWLVDFNPPVDPTPGERVNIDPRLVLGTVKVITNTPSTGGACAVGGSSRAYDFDFRTGSAIATAIGGVVGVSRGRTLPAPSSFSRCTSSLTRISGAEAPAVTPTRRLPAIHSGRRSSALSTM